MEKEKGGCHGQPVRGGLGLGILYHDSGVERERREGGGRDRREKRRRVNSLFLEAPLKRPPKLPPFSSPVPALTSLCLFFTCPSIVVSLLLGTVLYYLASFALFSLDLSHTRYRFLSFSAFFCLPLSSKKGIR